MATPTQATGKTAATEKTTGRRDAIALLKADHREVEEAFRDYEKARTDARKAKLSAQICLALKVHTQIEEEYFYPASREVLSGEDEKIVDEAYVEHASAKQLIAEIEAGEVGDDIQDARMKVLSEQIAHHVEEEEKEFFPKVKQTDLDLNALGATMAARKKELMIQLGGKQAH